MTPLEPREVRAALFEGRGNRGIFVVKRLRGAIIELLDRRNTQVLADLVGQHVTYLGVARDGRSAILLWVVPPGVISAFSEKFAAVTAQVAQ